jgi:hypothetical protein
MFDLSQSIEIFLHEFLELLILATKCLRSKVDEKDDQNSTKTKGDAPPSSLLDPKGVKLC